MVAGDICEPPLNPEAGAELPEGELSPARPNGSAEPFPKPVDAGEDDTEEVSFLRASIALDAAPRASNIKRTPTNAAWRDLTFHADGSANLVPWRKSQ
jgi:hypothetical protein